MLKCFFLYRCYVESIKHRSKYEEQTSIFKDECYRIFENEYFAVLPEE
jgi:hypothetical protein